MKTKINLLLLVAFVSLTGNTTSVHFTDDSVVTDVCGIVKFKDKYHIFYQYFNLEGGKLGLSLFQKVS